MRYLALLALLLTVCAPAAAQGTHLPTRCSRCSKPPSTFVGEGAVIRGYCQEHGEAALIEKLNPQAAAAAKPPPPTPTRPEVTETLEPAGRVHTQVVRRGSSRPVLRYEGDPPGFGLGAGRFALDPDTDPVPGFWSPNGIYIQPHWRPAEDELLAGSYSRKKRQAAARKSRRSTRR